MHKTHSADHTKSYLLLNEGTTSLEQIDCLLGINPILHEDFLFQLMKEKTQRVWQIALGPYPKKDMLREDLEHEIFRTYGIGINKEDYAIFLQRASCGCIKTVTDAILIEMLKEMLDAKKSFSRLKVVMPCPEFEVPIRIGEENYEYYYCPLDFKQGHEQSSVDQMIDRYVEQIKTVNPDIVYFSNPNNPFGYFLSDEQVLYILEHADKCGAYIFADEVYIGWKGFNNSSMRFTDRFPRLLAMSSLSKFHHAANLRIGWVLANKVLDPLFLRAEDNLCIDEFSNQLGVTILQFFNNQPAIPEGFREECKIIKKALIKVFEDMYGEKIRICATDEGVSIFTVKNRDTENPKLDLYQIMRNADVLVVPGDRFFHGDMTEKNSIRVRIPAKIEYVEEIERRLRSQV